MVIFERYLSRLGFFCGLLYICEASLKCENNGTVVIDGEDHWCQCPLNFTGDHCEEFDCKNGLSTGSFYNPNGTFFSTRCICDAGWTGELCDRSVIDCGKYGEEKNGKCECQDNFYGDSCEKVAICESGHLTNGRCLCAYGWSGLFCNKIRCNRGTPIKDNRSCECPMNFRGTYCDQCADATQLSYPDCVLMGKDITNYHNSNLFIAGWIILTVTLTITLLILLRKLNNDYIRHSSGKSSTNAVNHRSHKSVYLEIFVNAIWRKYSVLAFLICLFILLLCLPCRYHLQKEIDSLNNKLFKNDVTTSLLLLNSLLHLFGMILSFIGILLFVATHIYMRFCAKKPRDETHNDNLPTCLRSQDYSNSACASKLILFLTALHRIIWTLTIASLITIELSGGLQKEIAKLVRQGTEHWQNLDVMKALERKNECCGIILENGTINYLAVCPHIQQVPDCTEKLAESLIGWKFCMILLSVVTFVTLRMCGIAFTWLFCCAEAEGYEEKDLMAQRPLDKGIESHRLLEVTTVLKSDPNFEFNQKAICENNTARHRHGEVTVEIENNLENTAVIESISSVKPDQQTLFRENTMQRPRLGGATVSESGTTSDDLRTLLTVPGFQNSSISLAHNDRKLIGYLWTDSCKIVHIDFETAKRTNLRVDQSCMDSSVFQRSERQICSIVMNSTQLIILAMVINDNGYMFLSISINLEAEKALIIDKKEILKIGFFLSLSQYFFQKMNNGNVYSLIIMYHRGNSETIYEQLQISLDSVNTISIKSIFQDRNTSEAWHCPFTIDDKLCFLPRNGADNRLKIVTSKEEESEIYLDGPFPFEIGTERASITKPLVHNGCAFFYYYCKTKNMGALWMLDMSKYSWKCIIEYSEHVILVDCDGSRKTSLSFMDERLYIHGNCSTSDCAENAHIFIINIPSQRRYVIRDQVLGHGSFGAVYCGSIESNKNIAIKVLDDFSNTSRNYKKKLLFSAVNEAEKLQSLDHVNIIKGYGYIIETTRILLFMERMNESVRERIERSELIGLEEQEALSILQQVLEGLVYLHTMSPKPIVHGGIKCAKILLDTEGMAKLGDFGVVPEKLIKTREAVFWQAPEVQKNDKRYGRKADVWSIGCSLVEMLTGYPPYYCRNEQATFTYVANTISGHLSYSSGELVPTASNDVYDILEKTFRRATKQLQKGIPVRPSSSELLADVLKIDLKRKNELILFRISELSRSVSSEGRPSRPISVASSVDSAFSSMNESHYSSSSSLHSVQKNKIKNKKRLAKK